MNTKLQNYRGVFFIFSQLLCASLWLPVRAQPSVTTLPPANDNGAQATFQGMVNPNGSPATAWFQYGTTPGFGNLSAVTNLSAGNSAVPVGALINVSYSTRYYYQLVATNAGGTSHGTVLNFTTPAAPVFGPVTDLHNFNGYNGDAYGGLPASSVIACGNYLYGTTVAGGPPEEGVVYRINKDGTGFTILHAFLGAPAEGKSPYAALALCSNVLYGTTLYGGSNDLGTVFSVNTDGTGFTTLYNFTGVNGDGDTPYAGVVLCSNVLYGATSAGGNNGSGTLFSLRTDGSAFTNFYEFTATDPDTFANSDGSVPLASLILSGSTLFGTAGGGGLSGAGTVFSVNTDGSNFQTLYSFGFFDGYVPEAPLALDGTVLYGTTSQGGQNFDGNVFSIDTNTLIFADLYDFTGVNDGAYITAGVAPTNGMLYGASEFAGTNGSGTIYELAEDGSSFNVIYAFSAFDENNPTNADGFESSATPLVCGNNLYGTALGGGPAAIGTIFDVTTSGKFTLLWGFDEPTNNADGENPDSGLSEAGNTLYSTTPLGGNFADGTVFKVNTDGSGFETLHNFTQYSPLSLTNTDGAQPEGGVVFSGGMLYGTALIAGPNANGTVFSLDTNGDNFSALYGFSATDTNGFDTDGADPAGGLIASGGTLYGTTSAGGASGNGTIFALSTDGSTFQTLYSFSALTTDGDLAVNADGASSDSSLLLSGGTLYGTAGSGGAYGAGTIFSISTNGANFTTLYSFTGGADGLDPEAGLVLSGNTLYGATSAGGAANNGTIFRINTDGSGFEVLHTFSVTDADTFTNDDGAVSYGNLVVSGNILYGTASVGGQLGQGTVFQLNTDGSDFLTLLNCDFDTVGGNPQAGLLLSNGNLYGSVDGGGLLGQGAVFALNLRQVPVNLTIRQSGQNVVLTWPNPYLGLQASAQVETGYTNIVGATSPFTNSIGHGPQFFRLTSLP